MVAVPVEETVVPIPEPLKGAAVKLARAGEHLETINAALRSFIEVELNNSMMLSGMDPENPGWQIVSWATPVPEADPRIGAILGDFVHNVRSALDQLMWSLVAASGGKAGNHTHWPIIETDGQWRNSITNRPATEGFPPTHGITDDALQLVKSFQPLTRGRKGRSNAPLMQLLRLSNEDKHRTLHASLGVPVQIPALTIEPPGYVAIVSAQTVQRPIPVKEGAPLFRVKLRQITWPPPEGVEVRMKMPKGVGIAACFYKADGTYVAAAEHLTLMLDEAVTILEAFARRPEFTGQGVPSHEASA